MPVGELNRSETSTQKRVNITISKDSMSASIVLRKPASEDPPITVDEIMDEINKAEIVYGIDKPTIEKAVNEMSYNIPIKIASGTFPKRGVDSEFTYNFDTSQNHKPEIDVDGRIDYKNINFIQNIEKDQTLVTKIPARPGEPGTNILGKSIKGPDGRNFPFKYGANTAVSEDGLRLIATASGAIVYLHEKVSVNDVMVIKGDVDFSVGNIDCRGSVRVNGSIKAGFELKIDGDLEVNGNVEDCNIDVKGNIMVKGGFFGKGSGTMHAGGDVYVKFAEGQNIEAKGDVNIGGEVINCHILTGGNVCVKGKKGKIVGGEVKANKEIKASFLGSQAGTATILAVSYDLELMGRYHNTIKEITRLKDDEKRVKEVLYNLYKLQIDNKLNPEQKEVLSKLEEFQKELPGNLDNLRKEKEEIEESLKKLEGAQIIAENTIYPGVKAYFGLVYRDILEEEHKCVLGLEGNKILISEYQKK